MTDHDTAPFDTSTLKLGKGDAVRPVGLADFMTYTRAEFPRPPATFGALAALQAVSWGMDGNDTLGDCTIAGADHILAAENALLATTDARPDLKVLEAQYYVLSPENQGCVLSQVLSTWRSTGLFDMPTGTNKISLYAPFDHRSQSEFHRVITFTGNAYLGINCPQSAQQQFGQQLQTGQLVPWTVVPGSPIEGGHCIVAVGYVAEGLYCITWGGVVLVTWAFMKKYCDEGWAVLSQAIVERGQDSVGLDVAQLESDLDGLAKHHTV